VGQDAASIRHHCRNTNVGSNGTSDRLTMTTLYRFSLKFYRTTLWIVIPFYFLLFLASGHEFEINLKDFCWIFVVGTGLILSYFTNDIRTDRIEESIFKYSFGTVLTLTLIGSLILFVEGLEFKFGDDSQGMRLLTYTVPLMFAFCDVVLLYGLITKRTT